MGIKRPQRHPAEIIDLLLQVWYSLKTDLLASWSSRKYPGGKMPIKPLKHIADADEK